MKYFDYAATCPIDEEALTTYVRASKDYYGNTSSVHDIGSKSQTLLEHCRGVFSKSLDVDQEGIYFTSGGTESNYIGLHALARASKGRHIIASEGEHSSIRNTLVDLEAEGYEVSMVSLTDEGVIDLRELEGLIKQDTAVVSIQHINSNIGTIQPIKEVYHLCEKSDVLLHSDCVQSFGKIELEKVSKYLDSFSLSSHKVYGPKGVGAVYIRPSLSFQPLLPNGTHESGVRAGTVNTPGIAAFTVAAEKNIKALQENQLHIRKLKEYFCEQLKDVSSIVTTLGSPLENDVPIIGLCVHEIDGQWIMLEGNRKGYAFSTGSACQVRSEGPPKTLLSMGIPKEQAKTFIRISFGYGQNLEDVQGLAECLKEVIQERSRVKV